MLESLALLEVSEQWAHSFGRVASVYSPQAAFYQRTDGFSCARQRTVQGHFCAFSSDLYVMKKTTSITKIWNHLQEDNPDTDWNTKFE